MARLSSKWAFIFLIFSLQILATSLYSSQIFCPFFYGRLNSPFVPQVSAKAPCSLMSIFFPTGSSYGTWGWPAPVPFRFPLWGMFSLPGPLCPTREFPKGLSQPMSWTVQSLPSRTARHWRDWDKLRSLNMNRSLQSFLLSYLPVYFWRKDMKVSHKYMVLERFSVHFKSQSFSSIVQWIWNQN